MGGRGSSSATSKGGVVQLDHRPLPNMDSTSLDAKEWRYGRIMDDLGVSRETAEWFEASVWSFLGGDYAQIRESQREGDPSDAAKGLEGYVNRAPKWGGGTTYRGVGGEHYADLAVGDVIDMGGTSSWSTDEDFATRRSGMRSASPVLFVCETQRHGTSTRHLSPLPSENEVTVSMRAQYEVVKVETATFHTRSLFTPDFEYKRVYVREV